MSTNIPEEETDVKVGPFDPEFSDRPDAVGPEDVNDEGEVISK